MYCDRRWGPGQTRGRGTGDRSVGAEALAGGVGGGGDNGLRQTGTLALGGGAELGAGRRARWFVVRRVGHVLERGVAVLLNKSRLKRVSAEAAA